MLPPSRCPTRRSTGPAQNAAQAGHFERLGSTPVVKDFITAKASIRFLSPEEGGRETPVQSGYRLNHNFGSPDDREMQVGVLEFENGAQVVPGASTIAKVSFVANSELTGKMQVGREWRIQEGKRLVALARIEEVLNELS